MSLPRFIERLASTLTQKITRVVQLCVGCWLLIGCSGSPKLGPVEATTAPAAAPDRGPEEYSSSSVVQFCNNEWPIETKELTCPDHRMSRDLSALSKLTNLETLDLRATYLPSIMMTVADNYFEPISKLQYLRLIRLENLILADDELQPLQQLKSLRVVELNGVLAAEADVKSLEAVLNITIKLVAPTEL
ncbi:MAG: hypothetical protein JKY56_06105 [Kofleriaceae bacterium]|nr:hypothetical protein [Kofleriaceae bacterium]